MQAFAALLDRLVYTRSRNAKLRLIADYLLATPDPDRGWALAALTGGLDLKAVQPKLIRTLLEERIDPVLLAMSYDYVGDMAETASLLWPDPLTPPPPPPSLNEVVERLQHLGRADAPAAMRELMDRLDSSGRYALLKLATGAMRIGVSARLAKTAFALAFSVDVDAVEEVWHGLKPPYPELFDWGTGGAQPTPGTVPVFRPFMLAHPLDDLKLDLKDYAAEWKWDGIRIQIVHVAGVTRLFSRAGDDITGSFPEIAAAFAYPAVLDGELLVRGDFQGGEAASFNALQQRLGRKAPTAKAQAEFPAFVRLYDVLFDGDEDLRALPWTERRVRLEALMPRLDPTRFDLSAVIAATDFEDLARIRDGARDAAIEGVMLKQRTSPYVAGRRTGLWYKWKRDPLVADCVMMYAQRGHGKRSSFYSDYTFGCWTADPAEGGELLPVGKAYSGFTDAELAMLDKFVRTNTVARFGPVREVAKTMVLEVAFDSLHKSTRHKSGVSMRFPRVARIRTDKPAIEADRIETLVRMIT
ncbi:cisplatin damage response ATP-dependent DNA ligase [Polymorphobacter megasporae]|uniref:cisplatin damage response ATP-dependent DNA ligase n=1 Tax=Glacieibacterium megasporae TaxID=2835787 RepID=UPI001C1E13CF|nr:cisplatin damage response ATP-dependent DNA ligase [Polymorphobacter megasporae]UAJ10346.1 cisplatin damage response ATP-dependent DNA ligase [Polymorphobacter megasporae]